MRPYTHICIAAATFAFANAMNQAITSKTGNNTYNTFKSECGRSDHVENLFLNDSSVSNIFFANYQNGAGLFVEGPPVA